MKIFKDTSDFDKDLFQSLETNHLHPF